MGDDRLRDLYAIQRADPDGHPTEPTDADHARFKAWVVEQYGREVWNIYQAGGWGPSPEV
jgi:hypothetical protein